MTPLPAPAPMDDRAPQGQPASLVVPPAFVGYLLATERGMDTLYPQAPLSDGEIRAYVLARSFAALHQALYGGPGPLGRKPDAVDGQGEAVS